MPPAEKRRAVIVPQVLVEAVEAEEPEREQWFHIGNTWYSIFDRKIWTVKHFDWYNGYWYPAEWTRVDDFFMLE